ncbi:alpha/beta fold hydrolase [Actinophytocola sp. KF-1]
MFDLRGFSVLESDGNPTLLLLHAAGLDRTSWDDVIVRIPGFARTVAIDLPEVAYDRNAVPLLAEHVAARITELGLHRPHVVGHSLGASVALELACRVPVAAVTGFCALGFHTRTAMCATKMRALMGVVRAAGPVVRQRLLDSRAFHRVIMSGLSARPSAIEAAVVAADVNSLVGSDLVALTRFACRYTFVGAERLAATPVNLVWARQDRVVPPCDARRAARLVPHARHTAIVDAGHLVMRDDPDGTAAVVHACHSQLMRDLQRRAAG